MLRIWQIASAKSATPHKYHYEERSNEAAEKPAHGVSYEKRLSEMR